MKDYAALKVKVCVVCEGFSIRTQHARYDQYVVIVFCFFLSPANPGFDEDLEIPQIWASVLKNQAVIFHTGPVFFGYYPV